MNTKAQNRALLAGSVTLSLPLGTRSAFSLFLVPLAAAFNLPNRLSRLAPA